MFPRMICYACAVLWVDEGDDLNCWCCGQPGARTGEHIIGTPTRKAETVLVDLAAAS